LRNYEKTVDDLKNNLRNSDEIDLFISTWNFLGIKKINKKEITLTDGSRRIVSIKDKLDETEINYQKIKNLYNPTAIKVFDLNLFEGSIESYAKIVETSNLIDLKAKIKPKNYLTLMRRYSMFFMSFQGWKLMEDYSQINNIKYSKVIKIRSDFERGGYYPKIRWNEPIPKDNILIGDWNLQKYSKLDSRIKFDFQDHFAMGSFENMRYYFNIFNNLHKLSNDFRYKPKMWHAEYCLSLWLTKNKIKCQVINRNNLDKGRFDYLEIGTSCYKTLAEVYRNDDNIRGLSLETNTILFNKLKKFYKKSKNKFFENSFIKYNDKEKINLYFIDPNKVKNLKNIDFLKIGFKSLEKLRDKFEEVSDFELKENMIKKIDVCNLSFKKLIEKYNIDSIGFLKIHKEGVDYETFIKILESGIIFDAIQFDTSTFINDLQIKKVLSFLEKHDYICRDLANNKINFYCAKNYINFDKYLNLNYENKNNWIDLIKNIKFNKNN
tara:strand:- start:8286 stop:9764 length:1479 start_codon:yes stop_codon:yes gene_type:complete